MVPGPTAEREGHFVEWYGSRVIDPRELAARAAEDEARDRDRFRAMTPEERLRVFVELCELTDSISLARPDAERLRAGTPLSPESEALWTRLMERGRGPR